MVCGTCKDTGVKNTALGKEFYYCRTCKKEIELESVVKAVFNEEDIIGFDSLTSLSQDDIDELIRQLNKGVV